MAKYIIEGTTLQAIADAIREKRKTTGGINPAKFAEQIMAISDAHEHVSTTIKTDQGTGELWIDNTQNVDYMVIYVNGQQEVAQNVADNEGSINLKSILEELELSTGQYTVSVVLYADGYRTKTLDAIYTVSTSGGGGGVEVVETTYWYDDVGMAWYERTAGTNYNYSGECPNCHTKLYTNHSNDFYTECPSCSIHIKYARGDVTQHVGGSTGDGGFDASDYATVELDEDGVFRINIPDPTMVYVVPNAPVELYRGNQLGELPSSYELYRVSPLFDINSSVNFGDQYEVCGSGYSFYCKITITIYTSDDGAQEVTLTTSPTYYC